MREAVECEQKQYQQIYSLPSFYTTVTDTNTFIHMQSDTVAKMPSLTVGYVHTDTQNLMTRMFRAEVEFTIPSLTKTALNEFTDIYFLSDLI